MLFHEVIHTVARAIEVSYGTGRGISTIGPILQLRCIRMFDEWPL